MKKFAFAIIGIMMLASATSCKRSFTCTCVYPGKTVGTTTTTIKAVKKSDAEATCSAQNIGAQANGGSCALN